MKRALPWLLALTMVLPLLVHGISRATPLPGLIITEIVPASNGTGQPYEYVEIYNTTNQPIDLSGYKLLYYTASPYTTPANRWTITSAVIPARSALVLWLKKYDYPGVPLADFNSNYGTSLTPEQVYEVRLTTSAQGLHDSSKRRVAIARSDEAAISAAYINDGVADGTGSVNKSVIYKYADAIDMQKIANGRTATPGVLVPEQVPSGSDDQVPPPVPTGLTAEAGAGVVALQWSPVDAQDLAGYRVYRDGALQAAVGVAQTGAVVERLAGGTYWFTVSAIDQSGNESARSEPVSASPGHEQITQQQRGAGVVDDRYVIFRSISTQGAVIPGLVQDLIPQGQAWWPEQGWLVTSAYLKDGRPSVLTVVDSRTGTLVKSVRLYQEDGAPYIGHAGGVAISRENLWVSSGSQLYRIPLAALLAAPDNGNLSFADRFPVVTNASFVAYADGVLWVGEFYHPTAGYNTDPSHHLVNSLGQTYGAWVAGYPVDPATDRPLADGPAYVLSIRNQIQGMALTADSIVLSRSYGRKNDSHLYRYVRPDLAGAPHQTVTVGARSVPVWFLDETTQAPVEPTVALPPLAEGIATDGGTNLYVLFESGANEYRFDGFNPLDRWSVVDLNHWSAYGTLGILGLPQPMEVGQQAQVQVVCYLGNQPAAVVTGSATLAVADGNVARVAADGTVTALAPGETTITATLDGKQTTVALRVASVTRLVLSGAQAKLTEGKSVPLKVEATYSDGTVRDVTDRATFLTEHGGSADIRNGMLTGLKPGDIRVVARYGEVTSAEMRVIIIPSEAGGK